jgi:hypothetical protein
MKVLGTTVDARALLARIEERLWLRGLTAIAPKSAGPLDGAQVDPLSYNVQALEEHAESSRPLRPAPSSWIEALAGAPLRVLQLVAQPVITHVLARQQVFNGHVRDSYAQLAAEVLRLREQVESMQMPARRRKAK